MTDITILIQAAAARIPFASTSFAQEFLNQYSMDDQAALISAMYIGRDHLHGFDIQPEYVPEGFTFNRFFITGNEQRWDIHPNDFASILYEKNTNVHTYYQAFLGAVSRSKYVLQDF